MKFYLRNFLLILFIAFGSIFCWLIFISNNDSNHRNLLSNNIPVESYQKLQNNNEISSNNVKSIATIKVIQNITEDDRPLGHIKKVRNIVCKINGEYKINCLKLITAKDTSVFIPFAFIRKYFEINGKIVNPKSSDEFFEWNHSYSKIFYPDQPYSYNGKFLWFENYNVEYRNRVKFISATENVPISTQWYPDGHLYPTQISQYGLSHFNKNISSRSEFIKLIFNGKVTKDLKHDSKLILKKNYLFVKNMHLNLTNNYTSYLISQIEMKILESSLITIMVININDKKTFNLIYSTIDEPKNLKINGNTVTFGIGTKMINGGWFKLTRDLIVDLFKANLIVDRKKYNYYVTGIKIDGAVYVKNLLLKTLAHEEFALAAGDWLVRNQNDLGGWQINVKRKLSKGALVINEGWHSAMAQGQAISLLTRLFQVTNNSKYLEAAKKALNIFEVESFKNGVKAVLFDKYNWYEEYPTVPSIFVLNGFIYSLFGLYDLSKTCQDNFCKKSGQLYEEGLRSLEMALPLFDSGSGSFYDLRHLNLGIAPNLARWDYHSTHINQLLYLFTITRNDLFQSVAERWIEYMKGHRASHN